LPNCQPKGEPDMVKHNPFRLSTLTMVSVKKRNVYNKCYFTIFALTFIISTKIEFSVTGIRTWVNFSTARATFTSVR